VFEEGSLVGVIVWVYYTSAESIALENFTHKIASPTTTSTMLELLSSFGCHCDSYPYACPSSAALVLPHFLHWSSAAPSEAYSQQQMAFAAGILDR